MFCSLTLCTLAYVTYQDIRSLNSLREQTVIAIKAPPETRLEVPDPENVRVELVFIRFYNQNIKYLHYFVHFTLSIKLVSLHNADE